MLNYWEKNGYKDNKPIVHFLLLFATKNNDVFSVS